MLSSGPIARRPPPLPARDILLRLAQQQQPSNREDAATTEPADMTPLQRQVWELGEVRLPEVLSVPNHLVDTPREVLCSWFRKKRSQPEDLDPDKLLGKREQAFLDGMRSFWSTARLRRIVPILLKRSPITLSLIDWLSTNYARKHGTNYPLSAEDPWDFDVYQSYKQHLGAFQRPCFDPYCRNQRILVEFVDMPELYDNPDEDERVDDDDHSSETRAGASSLGSGDDEYDVLGTRVVDGVTLRYLVTTVGQLAFFRWAIQFQVIDYCERHIDEIAQDLKVPMSWWFLCLRARVFCFVADEQAKPDAKHRQAPQAEHTGAALLEGQARVGPTQLYL
ncbi:Hypothetical protein UVM_LOCUS394 [uncultured virus]|nr:Hypothetical protein UVM_LOCUS394 [uncultured virus]